MKYTEDNVVGLQFHYRNDKSNIKTILSFEEILDNKTPTALNQFGGAKKTIWESVQSWVDGGHWIPVDSEIRYEIY